MTTALCLQCGDTKFGALCPCQSCDAQASGDPNLDIAFSDHRMPVENLQQFGHVIRAINDACDDPAVRFWTFISYVSKHHDELLYATPPPELLEQVNQVLTSAELPIVDLKLKEIPPDDGPPVVSIPIPRSMFDRYSAAFDFDTIASVQVRDRNGNIHAATLMDAQEPFVVCLEDSSLTVDSIAAIRKAPGCLFGWLLKPKWIEYET